ncbi:uncharacterized protein LOC107868867 [Capsicum annuum]|uniref:uncharacterized protein LOC107868867 n=1 Tax=Capsicum annuum TaxID=4072 RepID=UPI0007BFDB45|nr:uncharacterized protein LOC107868867 [Capsicum annuum]
MVDSTVLEKKDNPRDFTIPCTIGMHVFAKTLCNLGAGINLMPFVIYKKLGLNAPTLTSMRLLMADQSIKRLTLWSWTVKWTKKYLSSLVVHLAMRWAIVDLEIGEMKFRVQEDDVTFKVYKMKKQSTELQVVSMVDVEIEEEKKVGLEDPP